MFSPVTQLEDLDRMGQDPDMSFESLSLSERLDVPWRQPPAKRAKPARSSLSRSQRPAAIKPLTGDPGADSSSATSSAMEMACNTAGDNTAQTGSAWQPRWELTPENYDIILVVDTMEQTGSRKDKGVIQVSYSRLLFKVYMHLQMADPVD